MLEEKAKQFKEEFLKYNSSNEKQSLNIQSMRLGVNSIITLSNHLLKRNVTNLTYF